MKELTNTIGCIILTIVLIGCPVLMPICYMTGHEGLGIILSLGTVAEAYALGYGLFYATKGE